MGDNHIVLEDAPYKSDLKVTKTTDLKTASVGTVIPYTITIVNNGKGDALNVNVKDIMGEYLEYVEDDSDGLHKGQTIKWTVDVPAGATEIIEISCKVKPNAVGKMVNKVYITDSTNPENEQEYEDNALTPLSGPDNDKDGSGNTVKKNSKGNGGHTRLSPLSSKTGDETDYTVLILIAAIMLTSGALATVAAFRRKRSEK